VYLGVREVWYCRDFSDNILISYTLLQTTAGIITSRSEALVIAPRKNIRTPLAVSIQFNRYYISLPLDNRNSPPINVL